MTEIRVAAGTEVGAVRRRNEDCYGFTGVGAVQDRSARDTATMPDLPFLAVVADGLGGHPDGDVASRTVVDVILGCEPTDEESLRSAIARAHSSLTAGTTPETSPGSTVAAVLILEDLVVAVNVGDSRIGLVESDRPMLQISTDDASTTNVPGAPASGLTRCLGPACRARDVAPHLHKFALDVPMRLMLSTDGLTSYVPNGEISDRVRDNSPTVACNALLDLAQRSGGNDNTTVLIVDIAPTPQTLQAHGSGSCAPTRPS